MFSYMISVMPFHNYNAICPIEYFSVKELYWPLNQFLLTASNRSSASNML